jgi:uncharacterized membrane protein
VISAIGAGVAYLTGEGAEEGVENIQGISKNIIKQHEDAATYALVSLLVLGALALFALFVTYKKSSLIKTTAIASLIFSFISFALVARTGYLGGQIRHSEISSGAVQNTGAGESGVKDDD